jgi:Fic family protein
MKYTFEHIDILLKDFNTLLPMSDKDQRRLDEKFRLEFTYNSNHMEGNTLTYQDTKALLLKEIVPQGEIYTMRELREMEAHDASFALIKAWAADPEREMNATNLKELNKLILVKDYWKDAQTVDGQPSRKQIKVGEYKSTPNSVQLSNGEMFHYADPIEVIALIQDLFDWYNAEKNNIHPIEVAARFHHAFVHIHPFDDGNGRISRLMVNYILMRNGLPPIVIKSSEKSKYLNALRLADVGDMEAFIAYIAEQVEWSLDVSIKAAQGLSIDEPGDLDKKLERLKIEKLQGLEINGKFSKKRADELAEIDILLLCEKIERILLKFDEYYNDRIVRFLFNGVESKAINLNEFYKLYKDFTNPLFVNEKPEINSIKIISQFRSPISEIFSKNLNSKIVSIIFNTNRIQINLDNKVFYFSYNDGIYASEMDEITEIIGNDLYEKMNIIKEE